MPETWIILWAGILGVCAVAPCGAAESSRETVRVQLYQGARTCRAVSTCREAVVLWCGGYRRADADDDGIPCENVCRSRAQVEAIKEDIGC